MSDANCNKSDVAGFAAAHGSAAVIVAEGYYRLKAENERLREWIRSEGVRTDACTYDMLGEICDGCRCKRYYEKQGYGKPPNDLSSETALGAARES
jgi:hypothetical protein